MAVWKNLLRADPTGWLLEQNNPSVRYLTLTNILGREQTDSEVKHAKADIMESGVVPKILGRQKDNGWSSPGRFYKDKYRGTVWQLIILAEHQADGRDLRIKGACEYILQHAQDPESYGFAHIKRTGSPGGKHSEVIPCLTGNMIWSLLKLGYMKDERVLAGIKWITSYQRFDDGEGKPPTGWPYDRYEMCWGRHSCHMGVVKALKALSALPIEHRNREVNRTITAACDYLLAHHVYKQSHNLAKTSKPGWRKLQFPLMYQTDILEIAGILVDLGVRDPRMQDAIDIIVSKQNGSGQWNLENTFNGRFQINIEAKGRPSKWITYRSMKVLKGYYGE
jgi:hypothetical protein